MPRLKKLLRGFVKIERLLAVAIVIVVAGIGVHFLAPSHADTSTLTGDLNNDGTVNIFDLSIFLTHWQQTGSGLAEDLNNDGTVNIFDLSILLSNYGQTVSQSGSPFPLQISSNHRYLEDAQGNPWLLVGDSPQSTMGNLSEANASTFFADREANGFNALWVNLLCDDYTYCASNGKTYDGVAPFTTGSAPSSYDLSKPNSAYFSRMHDMAANAEADNIELFLDPIETGGWLSTIENNGNGTLSTSDKDYQYGVYLGNEFKDLDNIVWLFGNDFQAVSNTTDANDLKSVLNGIQSVDPTIYTIETDYCGNFCASTSITDVNGFDTTWDNYTQMDAVYTYAPAYAEDRLAYGEATMPSFLVESDYEGEQNGGTDGCIATRNCRLQEWWTMTSGATGQLYGCACTTHLTNANFPNPAIDTTGVVQLGYLTRLMDQIDWQDLVPDTSHTFVTSGYGTCPGSGTSITGVNCVTDAYTPGGALAIAYLPDPSSLSAVTVNLASFSGPVTARWYDPTAGTFKSISGSPFTNSGTHSFTPTGNNNIGDKDWVLVLQAS